MTRIENGIRYTKPEIHAVKSTIDHERYLRLVTWAGDRFAKTGKLPFNWGRSIFAFVRMERAAARRFLGSA